MRKIQVLVAFVAVLAFSALAVSSASATLWLSSGRSLTTEMAANIHGLILLHNITFRVLIHCTGLFIGFVGPGALDLITLAEDLLGNKDLVSCEITADPLKVCGNVGDLVIVHLLNLPWHTLLELNGTITLDHILPSNAGYEVLCTTRTNISCETLETSKFLGNDSDGSLFEFNQENKARCSAGEGTLLGVGLVLGFTVS